MALTKISRGLLDTGVSDSSDATAITIDSSENVLLGVTSLNRLGSGSSAVSFSLGNTGTGATDSAEAYLYNAATDSGRVVGAVSFGTSGASASEKRSALISSKLSATSSTNVSGELNFYTTNAGSIDERMTIASNGTVTLTSKDSLRISTMNALGQTGSGAMFILGHNAHVDNNNSNRVLATNTSWYPSFIKMYYNHGITFHTSGSFYAVGDTLLDGVGSNSLERMRIDTGGNVYINRDDANFDNDGMLIGTNGGAFAYMERTVTGNSILYLHRRSTDGGLIDFYQGNSLEGNISVSGTTVSYNGFCGTHDSSGTGVSSSTQVGTVLSTIDEEHKADHAKVKVSDTEGDARVYGVLQEYKEEETNDDTGNTSVEHAVVASVGIGSVLVTGACNGGDLLESNGDGTAKVQSDDIIRSKTIGKVTIGNSDTGVKLVSCVLYCG